MPFTNRVSAGRDDVCRPNHIAKRSAIGITKVNFIRPVGNRNRGIRQVRNCAAFTRGYVVYPEAVGICIVRISRAFRLLSRAAGQAGFNVVEPASILRPEESIDGEFIRDGGERTVMHIANSEMRFSAA